MDRINGRRQVFGKIRSGRLVNGVWRPHSRWQPNSLVRGWATAAAKLFAGGDPRYRAAAMYLEFANPDDPDTPIVTPSYGVDGAAEYYAGLGDTADYVRVPLRVGLTQVTDTADYPLGNENFYLAIINDVVGVNGLTFSATVNSKIYGGALVATPVPGDASQDIVLARAYLEDDAQVVKLASSQSGLEWLQNFFVNEIPDDED